MSDILGKATESFFIKVNNAILRKIFNGIEVIECLMKINTYKLRCAVRYLNREGRTFITRGDFEKDRKFYRKTREGEKKSEGP